MISRASVADVGRAAALLNACFDDRVITVAGVRYRQESAAPEDRLGYWRAERGDELVGWAFGGLDAFAPVRTAAFGGLVVHPVHRRRGIGSALWAELSRHLEEAGARRLVFHSAADEGSRAFARRCGFEHSATHTTSAVDPRTIGEPPSPPDGVTIVPLSELDDPEQVFEADRVSSLDEPGPSDFSGMTYEIWRRLIWDFPDCDHELSAGAVADGTVVGTAFLNTDRENGRAVSVGTGVIPPFRGRGLGLLMKQHSLAWAAAAGITRAITQNDETNAPMIAINAKLGYQPFSSGLAWVLER